MNAMRKPLDFRAPIQRRQVTRCRCNPRRKTRFASTCRGCGVRVHMLCYHAQAHESHKPSGRIATVVHDGQYVFKRDA